MVVTGENDGDGLGDGGGTGGTGTHDFSSPARLLTKGTSRAKVAINEKSCQGVQLAGTLPGVGSQMPDDDDDYDVDDDDQVDDDDDDDNDGDDDNNDDGKEFNWQEHCQGLPPRCLMMISMRIMVILIISLIEYDVNEDHYGCKRLEMNGNQFLRC